jgi:hypothetical protein
MANTQTTEPVMTAEESRLTEAREMGVPWRQWGPYLSERQWGTVREDYSGTHGTISATIKPGHAPITGARMGLPD